MSNPSISLEVVQVKNKFNELRFYVEGGDAATRELIAAAHSSAFLTSDMTETFQKNPEFLD
jgi:hypothetical protein